MCIFVRMHAYVSRDVDYAHACAEVCTRVWKKRMLCKYVHVYLRIMIISVCIHMYMRACHVFDTVRRTATMCAILIPNVAQAMQLAVNLCAYPHVPNLPCHVVKNRCMTARIHIVPPSVCEQSRFENSLLLQADLPLPSGGPKPWFR